MKGEKVEKYYVINPIWLLVNYLSASNSLSLMYDKKSCLRDAMLSVFHRVSISAPSVGFYVEVNMLSWKKSMLLITWKMFMKNGGSDRKTLTK